MTEVVIIVSPSFDHRGKRRHDRFDARVKDTDEVICRATRQPVLDGSRVLIDKGYSPSTAIRMAYAHATAVITGWAIIGEAAQYDVMGEKFVRRKTTAGSMPSAPIKIDGSARPREPFSKMAAARARHNDPARFTGRAADHLAADSSGGLRHRQRAKMKMPT
ncbi:hypothetical protein J4G48_0045055 [Bradyrhizobium barranii subsp. apii]|uniref:hypothetical protein n=1 Tax=Bradyrhizobium barranii TaxID=2992140 RepID=UPI001AA0D2DE|nr:hypothetical protein [Bradyrhizobium barranii]UPT96130.1 hypothetical protein J4G48_0045055 [Bradyrhizobium barranii subsp. apii]